MDCIRIHGFQLAPSYNLFNLIAGLGLLKFWRPARWYALFIFGTAFFVSLPGTIWAAFNSNRIVFQFPSILIDDRPHPIVPLYLVMLIMLGYVAFSGWGLLALMMPDVRKRFQQTANESTANAPA